MKIKVFAYQAWAVMFFKGRIPTDQMELEIQDWLAKNPRIKVHEIKHDLAPDVWSAPELVVSIYYTDAEV